MGSNPSWIPVFFFPGIYFSLSHQKYQLFMPSHRNAKHLGGASVSPNIRLPTIQFIWILGAVVRRLSRGKYIILCESRGQRACYTCSTEGTIRGKNQQPTAVFLHDAKNHKYWTAVRHFVSKRSSTENKLTFFQKVLLFSDGKKSIEPCPIV